MGWRGIDLPASILMSRDLDEIGPQGTATLPLPDLRRADTASVGEGEEAAADFCQERARGGGKAFDDALKSRPPAKKQTRAMYPLTES